jgi:endoglucanase
MHLQIRGRQFVLGDRSIRLRGVGLGNWLNLEHFMLGIPGTDSELRAAIDHTYGFEAAKVFWDAYYSAYLSEPDLRFVRDLGMNSVRVPVNFSLFDGEQPVAYRELDRLIELAERLGLLVIIDLHAAPGGQNPDWHCDNATGVAGFWQHEVHRAAVIRLWEKLAIRYRDCTTIAGYDLLNEPCFEDSDGGKTLVSFYEDCITAIRRWDAEHVIFIEGNRYARDFSMFTRNLDDQVAYSFHYYPFLQIANDLGYPNAAQKLQERLFAETSLNYLLQELGRPIWCGETGHAWHLASSASVLGSFLEMLELRGISWSVWPLKDARAMGLLSPRANSPWIQLVRALTDNWSFWDVFAQDSVLSANAAGAGQLYYQRLAQVTTAAHERFRDKLSAVPFEKLCAAIGSFDSTACEHQDTLLGPIQRVLGRTG